MIGARCGCAKNLPEADPKRWPCPCGAHCPEHGATPLPGADAPTATRCPDSGLTIEEETWGPD